MGSAEYILKILTQFQAQGAQGVFASLRQELDSLAQRATQLSRQEVTTQAGGIGSQYAQAAGSFTGVPQADIARLQAGIRQMVAQFQSAVPSSGGRAVAQQAQAAGQAAQAAQEQKSIQDEIKERVTAAQRSAQLSASSSEQLAADEQYITNTARAAVAKAEIAAAVQEELAGSEEYIASLASATLSKAEITAGVQEELASSGEYAAANARATSAKQEIAAMEQQILAGDEEYAAATARAAQARAQIAADTKAQTVGLFRGEGESDASLQGRTVAVEQVRTAEQRLVTERTILANKNGELDAIVAERRAQAELNAAIQQQVRVARGGQGTVLEGGSVFQRLQAQLKVRQNPDQTIDPSQLASLSQFVGGRALTTASFAVSGAAIYGAIAGIREMVTYAESLDRVMALVRAEFDALGQGGEFAGFRSEILKISRDTGTAATDVAGVGLLMKGAFGDTTTAVLATRDAIEAMKVTGLSGAEAVNTFVALSKSFDETVSDISDKALGLQDRFGVAAKEILQGTASIAPIAKQVGLSYNELASIIAASAQVTGRPATAVAEGLGRILPQLQSHAAEIIQLYRSVPDLAPRVGKVEELFATGKEGQILPELIRNWKELSKAQQDTFISLLGGPRQAQILADALAQPDKLIQELDGHMKDAGRTSRSFGDLQASLAQYLSRVRNEIGLVGDALARMGAFDAFKVIFGSLELGLKSLLVLLQLLGDINQAFDGWPGKILTAILLFKALEIAARAASAAQVGAGVGGILGATPGRGVAVGGAEAGGAAIATPGLLAGLGGLAAGTVGRIPAYAAPALVIGDVLKNLRDTSTRSELDLGAKLRGQQTSFAKELIDQIGHDIPIERAAGTGYAQNLAAARKARQAITQAPPNVYADLLAGRPVDAGLIQQLTSQGLLPRDLYADQSRGLLSPQAASAIRRLQDEQRKVGITPNSPYDATKGLFDPKVTQAFAKKGDTPQAVSAADLQEQFAGGQINYTEYIGRLQELLGNLSAAGGADVNSGVHKNWLQILKQVQTAVAQQFQKQVQDAQTLAQSLGQNPIDAVGPVVQRITGQEGGVGAGELSAAQLRRFGERTPDNPALGSLQRGILDPATAEAQAQQLVGLQQQALQYAVAHAHSQAEAVRIAQAGQQVDPATERLYVDAARKLLGDNAADEVQKMLDAGVHLTPEQLNQIQQQALQEKISGIQLAGVKDRSPEGQAATAGKVAAAQLGAANALPANDPSRVTAINQANQAVIEAGQQADDANAAIAAARLSVLKAQTADDPVAQARAAQQAADLAARSAHGEADKLNATAQRVSADRAMQDALTQITDARLRLLQTEASAAGDEVGAARRGVELARKALDDARRRGDGEAQLADLQGQLDIAIQNAANTQISETEKHVQAQLAMKQISIGQAVAQLRALKGLAIGQDATDQLNTEIYSLLHQAGADLQFNLPSDINLPTLYETRRLNAGGYGTSGGNDNRVQTFQFYGSDATLDQIKKTVAQAAGATSSVFGSYARRT